MEDCKTSITERRTLIQAYERLESKCCQLREVANMTDTLNQILDRTHGLPKEDSIKASEPECSIPNVVDLFNSIADEMDAQINRIGNNTDSAINLIG